jgi:NADPH-dependent 2,4-dienoyl-CoA reductase/sulfur reductase-like enzyme
MQNYRYIIIGAGLAGGTAAEEIRKLDNDGRILLVGKENSRPYNRPPLSKELWFGREELNDIYLEDDNYYPEHKIEFRPGTEIVALDPANKIITDNQGETYQYEKLLLATGGAPRQLTIPGGDLEGIYYYRYVEDYLRLRQEAQPGRRALIIGGGFVGSEMAAALTRSKVQVTLLFPDEYIVPRVFPKSLGKFLTELYGARGVRVITGDRPAAIEKSGGQFIVATEKGERIISDMVLAGIGITPSVALAQQAGLEVGNGVVVNELLQTTYPEIYAAGDIAFFPHAALKKSVRLEHWDNALQQGKWAGRNMAGAGEPFGHIPDFWSDLFEFNYQAVGEIDSARETFADWQKENDTGVIYYLEGGKVRGVMCCNLKDRLEAARELIKQDRVFGREELKGAIK